MPSNILIIFEGAATEKTFIQRHFKALGKADSYIPFCYGCNIYNLYDRLVKNAFKNDLSSVDLLTLLKRGGPVPSQADKTRLDSVFTDIFLVFDLDIHDTVHTFEEKQSILRKMSEVYTDSSDNGLLLINAPMAESFRDYSILNDGSFVLNPPISSAESGSYKKIVSERGNNRNLSKYTREDFAAVSKMSLNAISALLLDTPSEPESNFAFQQQLVSVSVDSYREGSIPIYNEMSLIPFAIFGEQVLS